MTAPSIEAGRADCWRRIGVTGDRSCPELADHVHCRNCAVYAEGAQHSLQRPVDQAYRDAWARELAQPEAAAAHTDAGAMAFRIGREWLAVPLALVSAVAPVAPVHKLPHRGGRALLGIVNVNGRLLPALSLARLLDIDTGGVPAPAGRHAFARLLVLATDAHLFALPVDEVHGVLRHTRAAMRPPAATVGHAPSPLLAGMVRDAALEAGLLDAARLAERMEGLLR